MKAKIAAAASSLSHSYVARSIMMVMLRTLRRLPQEQALQMLEPDALKGARPVLRRVGGRKASRLLGMKTN